LSAFQALHPTTFLKLNWWARGILLQCSHFIVVVIVVVVVIIVVDVVDVTVGAGDRT